MRTNLSTINSGEVAVDAPSATAHTTGEHLSCAEDCWSALLPRPISETLAILLDRAAVLCCGRVTAGLPRGCGRTAEAATLLWCATDCMVLQINLLERLKKWIRYASGCERPSAERWGASWWLCCREISTLL